MTSIMDRMEMQIATNVERPFDVIILSEKKSHHFYRECCDRMYNWGSNFSTYDKFWKRQPFFMGIKVVRPEDLEGLGDMKIGCFLYFGEE